MSGEGIWLGAHVSRESGAVTAVRRLGQVIELRPERVVDYERLHATVWPQVLSALKRAHIRNYSIFRRDTILFAYLEYGGADLERDLADLASDPDVQRWWTLTEPMQIPDPELAPGEWWRTIPEVFHAD